MSYTVDPDDLIANSRALQRSTNLVGRVPISVRLALLTVGDTCGDSAAGGLASNLAVKWQLGLGMLVDGGASLVESLGTAGGAYSHNERVVVTALKVAS